MLWWGMLTWVFSYPRYFGTPFVCSPPQCLTLGETNSEDMRAHSYISPLKILFTKTKRITTCNSNELIFNGASILNINSPRFYFISWYLQSLSLLSIGIHSPAIYSHLGKLAASPCFRFGYQGKEMKDNLHVTSLGELLYAVGHVGIILNSKTQQQKHYKEHTAIITWWANRNTTKLNWSN